LILSLIGTVNSGNLHLSMHICKMLSNLKKRVLLVSKTEDPLLFFGIDKRLMSSKPLEVYGFDVFIGTDVGSFTSDYDCIVISTDSSNVLGTMFLVQNCCDIVSLTKSRELIKDITGKVNLDKNINLIFNNFLNIRSKASLAFIERELSITTGKKIKIPFDIRNLQASVNEQVDQRLNLKKFTREYFLSLVDVLMIADNEFKPDQKILRKMIG